jgi:hypothetical protein
MLTLVPDQGARGGRTVRARVHPSWRPHRCEDGREQAVDPATCASEQEEWRRASSRSCVGLGGRRQLVTNEESGAVPCVCLYVPANLFLLYI